MTVEGAEAVGVVVDGEAGVEGVAAGAEVVAVAGTSTMNQHVTCQLIRNVG